jgi:cardiolipin synthase C
MTILDTTLFYGLRKTSGRFRAGCVVGAALLFLAGCVPARKDIPAIPSQAMAPLFDTPSAQYIRSETDGHPNDSGFRLLTNNTNALMSRIVLADHAAHSIDLQYYIFENDATGRLVAQRLVAAADRGVRVRMLLDDIHVSDDSTIFELLDAHPNIEVRVFNPFPTRKTPAVVKAMQFLMEWRRLNRRMHNKSFIVDNTAAVIGGRNIGDAYFDAAREDSNFRDLDLIAIGPVVADASASFDSYWNSDAAYPIGAFQKKPPTAEELARAKKDLAHDARAFAESDYAQAVFERLPNGATADRRGGWYWGSATLLADQPEKIDQTEDNPQLRMGPKIKELVDGAQNQLLLISPYFIPGDSGVKYLTGMVARGVETKVLTNSLAATDEPAAYAGYSSHRTPLLKGGVQMYELRPAPGEKQAATGAGKSAGVSLHAKAVIVDAREVFIGSMNMDQRSKLLNTEMGLIVECPELAQGVKQFFDKAIQPENSFHVELKPQDHSSSMQTIWTWDDHGNTMSDDSAPGVSRGRRLEVTLLGLLPIEGLL